MFIRIQKRLRGLALLSGLVIFTGINCASLPLKDRAARTIEGIHTALSAAQDAEIQLYEERIFPELTEAKHREFHRHLGQAFLYEALVVEAMIQWRAGDPVPEDLDMLIGYINDSLAVLQSFTNDRVDVIIAIIQSALVQVNNIRRMMTGGPQTSIIPESFTDFTSNFRQWSSYDCRAYA